MCVNVEYFSDTSSYMVSCTLPVLNFSGQEELLYRLTTIRLQNTFTEIKSGILHRNLFGEGWYILFELFTNDELTAYLKGKEVLTYFLDYFRVHIHDN